MGKFSNFDRQYRRQVPFGAAMNFLDRKEIRNFSQEAAYRGAAIETARYVPNHIVMDLKYIFIQPYMWMYLECNEKYPPVH